MPGYVLRIRSLRLRAACIAFVCGAAPWGNCAVGEERGERARVELTIGAETVGAAAQAQQWYQVLTEIGVDGLTIRQRKPGEKVEIVNRGSDQAPVYAVFGVLTARNELAVPGNRFSIRNRDAIAEWLTKLRDEGVEAASGQAEGPFGLTAEQLSALREDLAQAVDVSTVDLSPREVVARLSGTLKHELALDPAAKEALVKTENCREELRGLAAGTVLTYVIRAEGLALEPRRNRQGAPVLAIRKASTERECWPVGFEPEKKPAELAPDLLEFLTVEIEDTAVSDVLDSISDRLKLPMLFDHYALARHGIDPTTIIYNQPEKRMTYSTLLGKSLMHARLKYELRVDEAGHPFAWITTIKPAR